MMACHLELGQLWRCPVTWIVFPPWTVTRDVWHDALRPDVSGVAVDALLFHEAGSRLVHRYRVYRDPFPHPALRDGDIPRLLSSVCRAMAIARLTHLRLSIPLSGAPPGKVPKSCFPDAETAVTQPPPRRVLFAEDANTLCTEDDSPVSSQISPPLTRPVVELTDKDAPASEGDGLQICSPESVMPPPPRFPPFVFPDDDGGIDVDEMCARLGECATETSQELDPGLPDIPEESETPDVVVP